MHQLAILSTRWAVFFHSTPNGFITIHFFLLLSTILFFWVLGCFSLGLDLTHNYLVHFPTLIHTAPTLVLYLLSPTDIATLITSYRIDLTTILTTYPTNLTTLHTQPLYSHKFFTNLITLIR